MICGAFWLLVDWLYCQRNSGFLQTMSSRMSAYDFGVKFSISTNVGGFSVTDGALRPPPWRRPRADSQAEQHRVRQHGPRSDRRDGDDGPNLHHRRDAVRL